MWFYRIQNKEGIGPYRKKYSSGVDEYIWTEKPHSNDTGRPGPNQENSKFKTAYHSFEYHERSNLRFGFISRQQLERWFTPKEIKCLNELGFKIKRISGDLIAKSKYQALFKPRKRKTQERGRSEAEK